MVVPGCDQVYRVLQLHLQRDAFDAFPPQGALVIAAEGEDPAIGGQYNRMDAATGHLVDELVE